MLLPIFTHISLAILAALRRGLIGGGKRRRSDVALFGRRIYDRRYESSLCLKN